MKGEQGIFLSVSYRFLITVSCMCQTVVSGTYTLHCMILCDQGHDNIQ